MHTPHGSERTTINDIPRKAAIARPLYIVGFIDGHEPTMASASAMRPDVPFAEVPR
jgi:hypothetical protein